MQNARNAKKTQTQPQTTEREEPSHVTRRRASSAPAHEVTLDDMLEVFDTPPDVDARADAAPETDGRATEPAPEREEREETRDTFVEPAEASGRLPSLAPLLEPPEPSLLPSSVAPVAMDGTPSSAPFNVPLTVGRASRPRSYTAAVVVALMALGVSIAALVRHAPQDEPAQVTQASQAPQAPARDAIERAPAQTVEAPAVVRPRPDVPVVEVTNLPQKSTDGTVVGMQDHRLWIDGLLAPTWKAIVPCGSHQVKVGSAGTTRTVDVPCGDNVTVSP